jgi:hypothetical protein
MLRAFSRMYGASNKHQRRSICPCLTTFWRSVCLNQGTARWSGGCFKPTWNVCRMTPRAPAGVADALGPRLGRKASIPCKKRGTWSLFCQLVALCVHRPGHIRRGRRLLQTDMVCMKGGPQGPGRCVRCIGPSADGTGCRSSTRDGVIGPYFVKF